PRLGCPGRRPLGDQCPARPLAAVGPRRRALATPHPRGLPPRRGRSGRLLPAPACGLSHSPLLLDRRQSAPGDPLRDAGPHWHGGQAAAAPAAALAARRPGRPERSGAAATTGSGGRRPLGPRGGPRRRWRLPPVAVALGGGGPLRG